MDLPMRELGALTIGGATLNEKAQAARQQLRTRLSKIRLAWRVVLVAVLITLAGIIWLSQTSAVVSYGYQIDKIDKQEAKLNREAQVLEAQIAAYESPAKIEQEAKDKLGLVYPDAKHVIFVKVQPATVAEPTSADAAGNKNPQLAQVSAWWRKLAVILPQPWQDSAPDAPSDK